MSILMAISDRSYSRTPLGGPNTNFGFFPMSQNGLFLTLILAKNGPKQPKIAILLLFLWVFALMGPKVDPIALGTCAGLEAMCEQPWGVMRSV